MTIMTADEVFRDYEIAGVPASGPHQVVKRDARALLASYEAILNGGGGPGLGYATLALLNADLAHDAHSLAIVHSDATAANNGLYQKSGATGTGSWTRIGDLPNAIVPLTVIGGTADAIIATAPEMPTVPGRKLYMLVPTATNTGAAMTIGINGAPDVAIKNALGSTPAANTFVIGVGSLLFWSVDHYQALVSIAVDTAGVVADAVAARDDAAVSEAAAAASASALGNQIHNYDSYVLAEGAAVPAGVRGLRVFGYNVFGDGPTASYFRVPAEPSIAGKLRTTDRFMPDGSTDATNGGWWQLVISGQLDVRMFGVFGDGVTDVTARVQDALATGSIFFPPASGNYILSGDVAIPSNRMIWVQKGATIVNTGGRFTGYLPGGGNVDFRIDGAIGFAATLDGPQLSGWPAPTPTFGTERGLIEFGGTHAAPAENIKVWGSGRVYSDYVWAGVPSGLYDAHYQVNRKGIAFWNTSRARCMGMELHNIHGEAIYFNGYENNYDITFSNNYVHDVGFNGLNFNVSVVSVGLLMEGNTIFKCLQGIEISGGTASNNHIDTCNFGIIFGAGAGRAPVRVTNNKVISAANASYDLEFDPTAAPIQIIHIEGNQSISPGTNGFVLGKLNAFQLKNNSSYNHASTGAGYSFLIMASCSSGHADGNLTTSSGAFSAGAFTNSAGAAVSVGTNPTF